MSLLVAALSMCCSGAVAATCITQKNAFPNYIRALAQDAQSQGVGQRGMQALASAQLSGITWRFESKPSSQSGTLQGDPANFLAKRSGSTAKAFIDGTTRRVRQNTKLF
ncbi:MAG: hypothetical protein ABJ327_09850, partial [Litoreibacter sp.]